MATGQEFAELVDQRRRRRMDMAAMEAEADHPARALGNAGEAEGIVLLDLVKRDARDGRNLRRVRNYRDAPPRPHHDRCDQVAGTGRVIVEQAKHLALAEFKAKLLVQLTQRGLRLRLAGIAAPAWQ